MMRDPKPGWQSTEMWLALAAALVGASLTVIPETSPVAKALGALAAALSSFGYSISRAKVKS